MHSHSWIMFRAYRHAVAVVLLGFLIAILVNSLPESALLSRVITALHVVPFAIFLWAFILICRTSYRLWQWERGQGPSCVKCHGPLGDEHSGRDSRGGAFRRCYACGMANNHRHYAHSA